MITEEENIKLVTNYVKRMIRSGNKATYVIIDGDRTLIPNDSTKYFFEYLQLDYMDIKNIFKKYGYTFDAFQKVADYYSRIEKGVFLNACLESAKQVEIYPEFISFTKELKNEVGFILVTSGITQSWQNVLKKYSMNFMKVVGGKFHTADGLVIDKKAKGIIAQTLVQANKNVFAFGDSMIDFEMLCEANAAFLVVNEKLNKDFIPYAREIPHLRQVSFSGFFHPDIPLRNLMEIKSQILAL